MESFSGDVEESTEDNAGRKKSKLKSLKTRLFRRSKRADGEANTKLSQSASDITAGKGLGSDEDLCSQGMMGSRAFSHDSIFLADEVLADTEPVRVLSQENVNSKIKALQMKLQQQKMHLGPPPLVLPIRRQEDHSEEGDVPHSPSEISAGDTTLGTHSKLFSHPLSPVHKPAASKPVPVTSSNIPSSTTLESPLDFSSPAQFTPRLDTSAACHRMSVKPRNQRASTKKRTATSESRSHLDTLNNINHLECVEDEQQRLSDSEEERGANISLTSQSLPSKLPQFESLTSEAVSISPGQSHQHHVPPGRVSSVSSQGVGLRPHRCGDVMSTEQPQSPVTQTDVKERKDGPGDSEIQVKSKDEINTLIKSGTADTNSSVANFGSSGASRSSPVHQQGETDNKTAGIKRPTPGSGSFHFSITTAKSRHGERPRSGSFVGVLERTGQKISGGAEDTVQGEKDKYKEPPYRGGLVSGRFRQEHKSPFLPWDKQGSLRKVEPATGQTEGQDVKSSSRDVVEEAVEAKEDVPEEDGKTMFGFKLRPTSQSMKFRSDEPSKHYSKEQCDKPKTQEIREVISKNLPTAISCIPPSSIDIKPTDPAPSGFTLPSKRKPPYSCDPHTMPTEVQTTSLNHKDVETTPIASQESQSTPQTTTPEVSWMSLAMEKTRSIQQLFTSRFPRDFTGGQAAVRPQASPANLSETLNGAQTHQTPVFKLQQSSTPLQPANQPSANTVQVETGPSHSVRSSVMTTTMHQKASTMSPVPLNTSQEPEKNISEQKSHTNTVQVVSQTVSQTNLRTTQSPTYLSQSEAASPFGQVSPSLAQTYFSSGQPPWSNRGVQQTNKPKTSPLTSVLTSPAATAPSPLFAMGKGEGAGAVEEKENPSNLGKQAVWAGSVSEKAAFLEKKTDWVTPPGTKGVELKRGLLETQSSGSFKQQTQSKDTKPEGRPGLKLESSPTKFPERVREDKWLRKNGESSSSPTSSLTLSQSDSNQPSWMELAKRKSMAWSDKNMD